MLDVSDCLAYINGKFGHNLGQLSMENMWDYDMKEGLAIRKVN